MPRDIRTTDDQLCMSDTLACISYCDVCGECVETKEETAYVDDRKYARDRYKTMVYRHRQCPFNGPCRKNAVMNIGGSCVDLPDRTRALTHLQGPDRGSLQLRPLLGTVE
jgi:hypothetical protein